MAPREKDQQLQRSTKVFEDQHGREWVVTLHNANLMPVGEMYLRQCRQPIPTPSKYVRIVASKMGKLHVHYDEWIRDIMASRLYRLERLQQVAEKSYGAAFAAALKDPPGELLAKLGPEPIPVEFIHAMKSGESKWALGIRRADGSFYPRPKWVTDSMWQRAQSALKQVWTFSDAGTGSVQEFEAGTFADEDDATIPVVAADPTFTDDAEDEAVVVAAAPPLPGQMKRPVGRPRKS